LEVVRWSLTIVAIVSIVEVGHGVCERDGKVYGKIDVAESVSTGWKDFKSGGKKDEPSKSSLAWRAIVVESTN